jgi:rhodanese-related sulfurtransferase
MTAAASTRAVGIVLVLVASVWIGAPHRAAAALSVQEAILLAKPAVALVSAEVAVDVTVNCGRGPLTVTPAPFVEIGTGWFVDGRGFLVTNAHVVDPAHRLPSWVIRELKKKGIEKGCGESALVARGEALIASARVAPSPRIIVVLSSGARLPAQVKKFSPPLLLDASGQPIADSGRDLALLRVQDGAYPALAITTRTVNIGDPVHILGFPGVVLTHELLSKLLPEASVTGGTISGFKQDAIGQKVVQTDAPAAHGNSGGPAILDDATVMGVLTFVSEAQGFNFLIPAEDVRAFLRGTEVTKPGESRFNDVWAAGVHALFNERYSTAVSKMKEANQLVPNLSDVKRQLAEAETNLRNPPPKPFPWAWVTAGGVSFVSLSVFGGMGARRWWKNRHRVLPAQVIGFIEHGLNPALLDVRTRAEFETSPLTLPGAIRLDPAAAAAGRIDLALEPAQLIVTYCTSPEERTSATVGQQLRQRGFRNVKVLKGGLGGWTNARLPVEAKSHLPSIGIEIYRNLTLGDIERRRFPTGSLIFRQGDDPRGEAYVVHAGTVEIRRQFDGTERRLNTVHEGELLGEMALFRKAPRSANAVAVTDVELLVIRNERLEWLMRNRPQLTLEVLKRLADLVVTTDRDRAEGVAKA